MAFILLSLTVFFFMLIFGPVISFRFRRFGGFTCFGGFVLMFRVLLQVYASFAPFHFRLRTRNLLASTFFNELDLKLHF